LFRGREAIPSEHPYSVHFLENKQLMVSLMTRISRALIRLCSSTSRGRKGIFVRSDNNLFYLEFDIKRDGFKAVVVPALDITNSTDDWKALCHEKSIGSVETDDIGGRGFDESIAVRLK